MANIFGTFQQTPVTLSGEQIITGEKTFVSAVVENLTVVLPADSSKQNQVQYNPNTDQLTYTAQVVSPVTTSGLDITGDAALISNTAGGSASKHLVIRVNNVAYKIALLNV